MERAIYVATPQLLKAFGICPSEINPNADVLSARPGLSGVSGLRLNYQSRPQRIEGSARRRHGPGASSVHPVIQEIGALPAGTSAPNTVITEHADAQVPHLVGHLRLVGAGRAAIHCLADQRCRATASTSQLSVESKNDQPSSSQVIDWATVFGIVLALGVLGMSVGLVRSETASDLRTLAAAGACSFTRRT